MVGDGQHQRTIGTIVSRSFGNIPALESIHELPGGVETFSHESGLLAHSDQGIFEEAGLVLRRRGGRHVAWVAGCSSSAISFGVVFDSAIGCFWID